MLLSLWLWVKLCAIVAAMLSWRMLQAVARAVGLTGRTSDPVIGSPDEPVRVAVIGGGIAGCSAAWALVQLQASRKLPEGAPPIEVRLFEDRHVLGGNAKTHLWTPKASSSADSRAKENATFAGEEDDENSVRTGLSVLGWPAQYFKNYEILLKRLNISRETVRPKFLVSLDGETTAWAHGEPGGKWAQDMQRWDRGVAAIRTVNDFFGRTLPAFFGRVAGQSGMASFVPPADAPPSFYEVSKLNPMNVIPARFVLCTVFGVSSDFWQTVVVSVYSSSFLTGVLDDIPAVIVPALDDIISVGSEEPVKPLSTWTKNSSFVFHALADEIGRRNIVVDAKIERVVASVAGDGRASQRVFRTGTDHAEEFDFVIFACPASSVDKLTKGSAVLRSPLFDTVIGNMRYETERDRNFVHGDIHVDRNVLPAGVQQLYFSKRFSNYVRVLDKHIGSCCNVFSLGTWIPPALAHAQTIVSARRSNAPGTLGMETKLSGGALDLYVSYDAHNNRRKGAGTVPKALASRTAVPDEGRPQVKPREDKVVGAVDNSFAHPVLSPFMMALAASLALLQGRAGVFYCGSYATPGNGHDLSHLSGLAAAAAVVERVMGQPDGLARDPLKFYAHKDHSDAAAERDFVMLRRLMGL